MALHPCGLGWKGKGKTKKKSRTTYINIESTVLWSLSCFQPSLCFEEIIDYVLVKYHGRRQGDRTDEK